MEQTTASRSGPLMGDRILNPNPPPPGKPSSSAVTLAWYDNPISHAPPGAGISLTQKTITGFLTGRKRVSKQFTFDQSSFHREAQFRDFLQQQSFCRSISAACQFKGICSLQPVKNVALAIRVRIQWLASTKRDSHPSCEPCVSRQIKPVAGIFDLKSRYFNDGMRSKFRSDNAMISK
jgi:hypothetical protein